MRGSVPVLLLLGLVVSSEPAHGQSPTVKVTLLFKFDKRAWQNKEGQTFSIIREDNQLPLSNSPIRLAPGDKVDIRLVETRERMHLVETWCVRDRWTTKRKQGKDTIIQPHIVSQYRNYYASLDEGIQLRAYWDRFEDQAIKAEKQLTRDGLTFTNPLGGELNLRGTVAFKSFTSDDIPLANPSATRDGPPQPLGVRSHGRIWFRVEVTISR